MFDDDILIDKWHFNVKLLTSLKTKHKLLSFPDGKKILRFKFNSVAKLYAEQLRRRNEKALPQDSLMHYLKTSKSFIGVEGSCKFVRKDYKVGEGKVIEQKQTTTAFCFDYDKLKINLQRFNIEDLSEERNGSSNPNAHSESMTVKAVEDDLPF